jgi:hypothetical protein
MAIQRAFVSTNAKVAAMRAGRAGVVARPSVQLPPVANATRTELGVSSRGGANAPAQRALALRPSRIRFRQYSPF